MASSMTWKRTAGKKLNLWDNEKHNKLKTDLQRRLLDKLIELSPRSYIPWNEGAPKLGG